MRLTVSSPARWLFGRAPFAAQVGFDALVLTTRDGDLRLARGDVRRVAGTSGWLSAHWPVSAALKCSAVSGSVQ